MLRQGLEQAGQALRALMAAGSPEDKAARQTDLAREALERATANARELVEIAARAQQEAGDVLAQRLAASLNELKSAIEAGQKR
jgi:phasin family protein